MEEKKVDKVIEEVKQMWDERSQVGLKKYGQGLDTNLDDNYLQHGLEEALDLVGYMVAFKNQMKQLCYNHPNDADLGEVIRKIYG